MRVCTIGRRRPATDRPGPGGTPHDQEDRMTQTTTEFLTADELAAMLNVPVRTVRRCWRGWGLTAYRVGRALRFRLPEVRAWLKDQRI